MTTKSWILTDVASGKYETDVSLTSKDVAGSADGYSVVKHTLRGGLDDDFETGRWLDALERRLPRRLGAFLYQRALDRFHFDELADRLLAAPLLRAARWLARLERRITQSAEGEEPAPGDATQPASEVR